MVSKPEAAERQREWHRQGGNGCVFARLAARRGETAGWRTAVVPELAPPLADDALSRALREALADPGCHVLSLLFPHIRSGAGLLRLCRDPAFLLERTERQGDLTAVSLRAPVEDGVLAWVMGFGPFEFFPPTRRAPVTELVLRTKPKGDWLYEKHSHDRNVAHVADIPLALPEACWDPLWEATHAATRQRLQAEPDLFSAARTTFTLPNGLCSRLPSPVSRPQGGALR